MKSFVRKKTILLAITFAVVLGTQTSAAAPEITLLPNPVLIFLAQEHAVIGGKEVIRYTFDVFNKNEYPADLFAAAPKLPPCGTNNKASRTWVDVFDQNGKRLQGFCSLGKPSDLNGIWFALGRDTIPPSWVYIEMTDRQTNTKYKSNLAETTQ